MKGSLNSPEMEGVTPGYVTQLRKEWLDFIVDVTPDEELFALPRFQRRLVKEHHDGHRDGKAKILMRQLQHRFGTVPEWACEKVSKAKLSSLEEWRVRILDAQSLGGVFSDRE